MAYAADDRSRILAGLYGGPTRLRDRGNLRYRAEGPWFDQGCGINPCTLVQVDRVQARELGTTGVAHGARVLGRITRVLAPSANHWWLNGRDTVQLGPTLMGQGFGLGASYRF